MKNKFLLFLLLLPLYSITVNAEVYLKSSSASLESLGAAERGANTSITSLTGITLVGIEPILYKYNELSGLDQDGVYAGFSAQNVMQYIPEAVGIDSRGYYSFNDRPVIAALVNAVKELQKEIEELRSLVRIISEDTYENINTEKKL